MYLAFAVIFIALGFIAILFSMYSIKIGRIPTYFKPFFGGARRKEKAAKYWIQIIIVFFIGILFFYLGFISYLNS